MSEVVAILLAAGSGSRYRAAGGSEATKLIAEVDGAPLARSAALAAGGLAPLIVVTGHARAEVEAALAGVEARFVHNGDYASGLASSLRAGLAAAPSSARGALVLLADMPRVSGEIVKRLVDAFAQRPDALAVIPIYNGERGNPVLLARALFADVAGLQGDEGARKILRRVDPARMVEIAVDDSGVTLDVDTPAALNAMRTI